MALDDEDIFNFRRLSQNITTSGQPTEAQIATIRASGIGTVINLALADSPRALPDEAATLAALGLHYIHIPVAFDAPTDADFARFRTTVESIGDMPVHVHCAANYRVAAFFYRYRTTCLGWTDTDARHDLLAVWTPNEIWQAFIAQDRG